jgi:hypothetical protein
MARAERIMSAFVPVITTVVTTAMSTVITVAHTRRGARSIVAAASGPTEPKIRAVADVALTMTAVSAKPSVISALNSAKMATKAKLPRWSTTTPIDAANIATAAIPAVSRSHLGTKSAAETPTGARASIGETL